MLRIYILGIPDLRVDIRNVFNLSRGTWVVSESSKVNCLIWCNMLQSTLFAFTLFMLETGSWKNSANQLFRKFWGSNFVLCIIIFGWQLKASSKRGASVNKSAKQDFGKDDGKSGKAIGRTSTADKDLNYLESRQSGLTKALSSTAANGSIATGSSKGLISPTKLLDIRRS